MSTTSEQPPFCCALFLRRSQRLHTSSMTRRMGKARNNYEYCENLAGRAPDLERKTVLGGTEGPVDGKSQDPKAFRVHVDVYVVQVGLTVDLLMPKEFGSRPDSSGGVTESESAASVMTS